MKIHAWGRYPLPKAVEWFSNSLWTLVTHEESPQFLFLRSIITLFYLDNRVPWIKRLLKDFAFIVYCLYNIQKNPSVETTHHFKVLLLSQMQEMLQMSHYLYLVSETQKIQMFEEEHNIFVFQNELFVHSNISWSACVQRGITATTSSAGQKCLLWDCTRQTSCLLKRLFPFCVCLSKPPSPPAHTSLLPEHELLR